MVHAGVDGLINCLTCSSKGTSFSSWSKVFNSCVFVVVREVRLINFNFQISLLSLLHRRGYEEN